ncbi:MAG: hypothetical protein UY92_C0012G0001 [Candidatus Magasanikbacteria bacterium GW2011_GWA2_56_11]|uniref:Uncharacterized protein n=1 Tax=Candidatus Magasanikbacteria bacterium GW2011_GWA2_56_11 TaxID=1619044 RepID=A0A0G2AKX7_9BACT|nr:MAG: hypothetical protein UY92_C0012G0001 [Candidatus Magasanikbacteria bacterium GW2011_GWA2_56_11]
MPDPLDTIAGLDAGMVLALVNRLGGRENVDALLAGRKAVRFEDVIPLLFDKHGRRIPPPRDEEQRG